MVPIVAALTLGTVGLVLGGFSIAWIAGTLGISAAAASQIVTAIEVGGWALVAVGAIFGGGITGALIATARGIIARAGRQAAVA